MLHGRLTHELVETDQGWELRPLSRLWLADKRFLLGFGLPFLVASVGLLSWTFHGQQGLSWPMSAFLATVLATVCGGTAFVLVGLAMRSSYRGLSALIVRRDGDMWLESPEPPDADNRDWVAGLRRTFVGPTRKERVTIPRASLVAVQLCPWKLVVGRSGSRSAGWGVQGLMVLAPAGEETYRRIPVLLTGDATGAARLMRRLGDVLQVPFLFGADASGWEAETLRAKNRPALRDGGMVS